MKKIFVFIFLLVAGLSLVACETKNQDANQFTVNFEVANGDTIASQVIDENGFVSEPTEPTKAGFTFEGWFKDVGCTQEWIFDTDKVTSDMTLYAGWLALSYTVTFESNGGSAVDNFVINYDQLITMPDVPVKQGFTFDGWYKDAEFTQSWAFGTDKVVSDMTLYAKWIEEVTPQFSVSFDTDGGSSMSNVLVDESQVLSRPNDPMKDNKVFAGWYKDQAFTELWDFENDEILENTTLYAKWKDQIDFTQTFKVLSIGNSFSEDAHRYLWSIAQAYGIPEENIIVANMYIGGSELAQHTANILTNAKVYEYQLYENQTIQRTSGVSLLEAIGYEDWDVITFQQASHYSGVSNTYADHIIKLTEFVEDHAINSNVEIMWHMTWAYQQTSTHSGFANYNNDQATMYQAIIDTLGAKIDTISQINKVIYSGTSIQNARTSYIGDYFTRDGYHLSDPMGRYIAGLSFFKAITGFDLGDTSSFIPTGVSVNQQGLAIEAVNFASEVQRSVTQSTFTVEPDPIPIDVNGVAYTFDYVQGFWNENATDISPTTDALHNSFAAVMPIPKYLLPAGSEIVIAEGYQYRVIFLEKTGEDSYHVLYRTALYQISYLEIDENWWGNYDYVAFNLASNPIAPINTRLDEVAGKFQLFHPEGTGIGHIDSDLSWTSGKWEAGQTQLTPSVNHVSTNPLTGAYYDYDTVIEVASGYMIAYAVLSFDLGVYTVDLVSEYQTTPLYIDTLFASDKPLIALILTTTNQDVDISTLDLTAVISMHPQAIPHEDKEASFISGYWELNKSSITTTNANMAFLNGFAASQPQSKHYYSSVESMSVEDGYQVRVIFLSYDGYGNYQVVYRTANLVGTIVMDETFWGDYEYIAFNFSKVSAIDLSSILDRIPSYLTYSVTPLSFELGYWNTNGTSLTASTSYAGSQVIPRQFLTEGSILHIESGFQVRIIFLTYSQEDGYKVVSRTENNIGNVVLTNGLYQNYQYIAFNISTAPSTSNLTGLLDTLPQKITSTVFQDPIIDHLDQALSFSSGYWNNFAQSITTGDTTFIKGFGASNVISKDSLSGYTSLTITAGYQVRVIYMDYSYNTYTVMLRSDNLTDTITLDADFWKDYQYIAFNISSNPSSDLSTVLETLPGYLTFNA